MPQDLLLTAFVLVVGGQLAVLAALALSSRPQRGVLVLAALAPFHGLLLIIPHPPLLDGWKEALVLATLGCAVLARLTGLPRAPAAPRPSWPPWAPALLGLVLVGLASAAWVGGTQAVLGLKINFFYVLLLAALLRSPLTARDRDRLVSILMVTGVVTGVVGIAQQVAGQEALAAIGYEYNTAIRTAGGLLRSFSTFNQPFPFGLYQMLVLLIGVPVALTELRRRRNQVFLLLTPLLVVGMLSSIVRAAIAGLVVGAVFLWMHRYRRLAHVVPALLVAALFLPAAVYGPLLSSTSLGQRSTGWAQTFGSVLGAPLGNGIGSTGSAAEKAALVAGSTASTYQPDNYYFKTVYELGPLGLWLLLLLLVSAFLHARWLSRDLGTAALGLSPALSTEVRRDAALAAGIAASVLAAMTASLVATYFEIFPLDVFFWLFIGVLPSLRHASCSPLSPSVPAAAGSRPTSVA